MHRELAADLERSGAALSVIGNGRPSFMSGFRDKSDYDGPLYTDPGRRTYRALGFRRGLGATLLNIDTPRAAVDAYRQGFRQTRTAGDPWQLGGVLVVEAGGEIVYEYASRFAGDHPEAAAITTVLSRASRPAGRSS